MSILRNLLTKSCTTHRDCLENVEMGIECHLSHGPVNSWGSDHLVRAESALIAREVEAYATHDFLAPPTYAHSYGFIGPVQISKYDYERVLKGEEFSKGYHHFWVTEYPKVNAEREILTYESHVGRVIATYTVTHPAHWDSGRADSYAHHAIVLNDDGTYSDIVAYWTGEERRGEQGEIVVDATPEMITAHANHVDRVQREADARREAEREAIEANTPRKGRTVRVVRGRKVPRGTEGEVFWYGQNQWGWSVGIKTAKGEKHFTAVGNVQVIQPDPTAQAAE